jgi:2-keto-4-pentenoate hydratase/2-oxohepta-3-ene-1,7-dioic acid hydratase in catechol pathway
MKVVMFSHKGTTPRVGIVEDDTVIAAAWSSSLLALIESGITPSRTSLRFPLAECKLLAPVRPGKVLCVGKNYAAHAAETGSEVPPSPLIFAKFGSGIIGDGDPIIWREVITTQVDWEGELAVIIGKRAKDVTVEQAPSYIFGYTIANDVTARDLQNSESQWARAKGMDYFCPLGPVVVTRGDIADPQALRIVTKIGDEVMQDASTGDMIHGVYPLIAYLSQTFTLDPGDLILTGTPAGVGMGMNPPRYLKDGEVVSVTIDGIGTLTNPCKVIA